MNAFASTVLATKHAKGLIGAFAIQAELLAVNGIRVYPTAIQTHALLVELVMTPAIKHVQVLILVAKRAQDLAHATPIVLKFRET